MFPKEMLIRVVKNTEGIQIDTSGKLAGRGAYVCKNADCLKGVRKSKRLDKIFHTQIPTDIYLKLEELSSNMEVR